MANHSKDLYNPGVILLLLLILVTVPARAQYTLFNPFTSFRVIETEFFNIIFPKESEPSARLLSSYADRVYEQVSTLLGIEVPGRIPVTFTPHTDSFNGYYGLISSPHIMLFDTPMDLEWTSFANNLESLFLHELTHAVSLNSRGPFFRGLHRIFGNWIRPTWVNAPAFMVEGVTVSFESLSGFGRANDPRIKQYLRQAVCEGKFLTPFQASGIYDIPTHESYYEYGGLFSTWLQQAYGMEKYAELWQALGRSFYFSFFVYRSGFYHIFKKVYNIDFSDAWSAFSASLALDGLETNNDELLPKEYRYFAEKDNFIQGLVARGKELFFYSDRKINIYDTRTGKLSSFNVGPSYDFDVSANATTLLLSDYSLTSSGTNPGLSRYSAEVTEYKTDSGRRTGRSIQGLYKARYFRDGVIGLRSDLHNNCIVYEDFEGKREILFHGNEGLLFSGPQAVDDEQIVFIASRDGKRELWLYNYVSRKLFRIENASGDNKYWLYMRGLKVSDGKIFFSHNANDRMYKLALIDLENMKGVFSNRDFSGGVFAPVSIDDTIHYLGAFVSRDSLLRFPEPVATLSGEQSDLILVDLDMEELDNYGDKQAEPTYPGSSRAYHSIRYMNPFNYWIPLPLIRVRDLGNSENFINLSLDGGGVFSMITDPTNRNLVIIEAYADIPYQMAKVNQLSWQNTSLGFPFTVSFSDSVVESGNDPYRHTSLNLDGKLRWGFSSWNYGFSLGGRYARNANYNDGKGAYEWEEVESNFSLFAGLSISYRLLSLQLSGISFTNSFEPRIDGIIMESLDTRFPLSFIFFGSYDDRGMDLHDVSNSYGQSLIPEYALTEYAHPSGLNLNWLVGVEAAVDLFSFEIQRNFSHVYINRFFGALKFRNQIYDSKNHLDAEGIVLGDLRLIQSLMLKLSMKASFFPIVKNPASVEPYIMGAWKLSNTITGDGFPWYFGLGVSININI